MDDEVDRNWKSRLDDEGSTKSLLRMSIGQSYRRATGCCELENGHTLRKLTMVVALQRQRCW